LLLALACESAMGAPKRLFDVTLEDVQGGGRMLNVSFYSRVPPPGTVDRIVRESLEHATLIDPKLDIVAMAFLGDDTLNSNQYSGPLIYRAKTRKIASMDEDRGVRTTTSSADSYFVEVQEDKTLEGIKPERKWLSVTIVFAKAPTQEAAYAAILAETQKLITRRLDVNAYVSIGNRTVKTSWKQMRDRDGAYVFAEYDAASKRVTRQGRLLKKL
jgi:hypothetical protein